MIVIIVPKLREPQLALEDISVDVDNLIEMLIILQRSYWIPGSYAPALSEKHKSFLSLLKNKGFKEENMTKIRLYALGTSTTLESNKSLAQIALV
jgi:hypothetical protein